VAAAQLYDPRWDGVQPAAVVEAAVEEDVATALAFAGRFGLPVRARSGGHSFAGASILDSGLIVSTTAMNQVDYDAGSQQVTIGAGTQLIDMYAGLDADGRTVPSGTCPTVGVSGLTMGGGLGAEMRGYGLTCDTVRAAIVVTPRTAGFATSTPAVSRTCSGRCVAAAEATSASSRRGFSRPRRRRTSGWASSRGRRQQGPP
jgi:FAD/FMN-containing dehydrogenase